MSKESDKKYKARLLGVRSELEFNALAFDEGIVCCKPYSDYRSYDFITDYKGTLNRVQVKAVHKKKKNKHDTWQIVIKPNATEFDVLACRLLLQEDTELGWILIPAATLKYSKKGFGQITLNLADWSPVPEWHLLKEGLI